MVNHILVDLLATGVIVYFDNILIYAKNEDTHDNLVKRMLERLAKNHLVFLPEKYIWGTDKVEFHAFNLTPQRMRLGEDKTKTITE
jgi:hypothetical protein